MTPSTSKNSAVMRPSVERLARRADREPASMPGKGVERLLFPADIEVGAVDCSGRVDGRRGANVRPVRR
jgi:hypothetical protein